ncbi:MAG: endonuclease III [Candidatus Micrarchaeia archaeon]
MKKLKEVIEILKREYGVHSIDERSNPLDVLVGTILSQNTSDRNSQAAFFSLKRKFPKWELVLDADLGKIQKAIRPGGLSKIKARRIKKALSEIRRRRGKLSLDFLSKMSADDAFEFLRSIDGIGPKTASVLLLFCFNKPTMPLDTHNMRIAKRLGLIPEEASSEKAHKIMNELIPSDEKKTLHINFILHGRKICRARNPECNLCVLNKLCDYYKSG